MDDEKYDDYGGEDEEGVSDDQGDEPSDIDVVPEEGDDPEKDGVTKSGYTKNKERITSKFLTKYERARILGTRAL